MKNLAQAQLQVQKQMKAMEKNADNPFFNSSYLPLETIQKELLPMLNEAGIVVSQYVDVHPVGIEGVVIPTLVTSITHAESGENLKHSMPIPEEKNPQKLGSLITYFKRYQLQAIFFVPAVGEDDDGNKASGQSKASGTKSSKQVSKSTATPDF